MLLTEKVLVVPLAVSIVLLGWKQRPAWQSWREGELSQGCVYACITAWSMSRSSWRLLLWSPPHFPSRKVFWSTQSCCMFLEMASSLSFVEQLDNWFFLQAHLCWCEIMYLHTSWLRDLHASSIQGQAIHFCWDGLRIKQHGAVKCLNFHRQESFSNYLTPEDKYITMVLWSLMLGPTIWDGRGTSYEGMFVRNTDLPGVTFR